MGVAILHGLKTPINDWRKRMANSNAQRSDDGAEQQEAQRGGDNRPAATFKQGGVEVTLTINGISHQFRERPRVELQRLALHRLGMLGKPNAFRDFGRPGQLQKLST